MNVVWHCMSLNDFHMLVITKNPQDFSNVDTKITGTACDLLLRCSLFFFIRFPFRANAQINPACNPSPFVFPHILFGSHYPGVQRRQIRQHCLRLRLGFGA